MPGGYTGRWLRVDLSSQRVTSEAVEADFLRTWLGGSGVAARLLYERVGAGLDAYDPENPLIVMTGPLTGTQSISMPRYAIASISPLNGFYASSSSSGLFGVRLKNAGFDGIVVEGRAEAPVYLDVSREGARLRKAGHLWGLTVRNAQAFLHEAHPGEISVAVIGPAGENLIRFAAVMSDWRAHGRSGMGAVMGAKNLKAIVVTGSAATLEADDPEALRDITRKMAAKSAETGSPQYYRALGTPGSVSSMNKAGILPTRNFQTGVFAGAEAVSGQQMSRETVVLSRSCGVICQLHCEKMSLVKSGPYAGSLARGPEYETLDALGALCGVDSLPPVVSAAELCDELGMDTISAGNVIAFAIELSERGILPEETTGGPLQFGDAAAVHRLIRQMAYREGLGDVLAEGVRIAAQKLGADTRPYALHVKGVELPAYDPRGAVGMGLGYATAFRGADHIRAFTIPKELADPGGDRYTPAGKASMVKETQDLRTVFDAVGICVFLGKDLTPGETAQVVNAVTGFGYSPAELLRAGERIWNQERLLAVREGVGRGEDVLPPRLMQEPLPEGPAAGHTVSPQVLDAMLDEYYDLRGWNRATGHPTPETLQALGIN